MSFTAIERQFADVEHRYSGSLVPIQECRSNVKVDTHRTRFGKAARFFSFHSQISLLLI